MELIFFTAGMAFGFVCGFSMRDGRLKNRLLSRQWDEQLQDRDEVESRNTPQTS